MTLYQNLCTVKLLRDELRIIDCREKVEELTSEIQAYKGNFQKYSGDPSIPPAHRPPSLDEIMGTIGVNAHVLEIRLMELRKIIDEKRGVETEKV